MHALVVAASPLRPSAGLLRAQADHAGLVVAVDGGAVALRGAGVRIDLFVGDGDSTSPELIEHLRENGSEVLLQPVAKDDSDLGIALDELSRRGVASVTIAGVVGGRLDHELAALGAIASPAALDVELMSDEIRGWLIRADSPRPALRLTGRGATVSVFAVGGDARVTLAGTAWPLSHELLSPLSPRGLSNLIHEDEASITAHTGSVLVLSPSVDGVAATRL